MTEKELTDGCRHNDRRAQNLLFNKFERKVFAICRRYAGSNDISLDIQQEAFIRIFQSLMQAHQPIQSLESWIHRITVNVAIDHFRKERKLMETVGDDMVTTSIPPEILSRLDEEQLIALLQTIPSPYRLVFNLFVVDGFNHREIADQLGITESSSRAYLVRAKEFLKKKLTGAEIKLKGYG